MNGMTRQIDLILSNVEEYYDAARAAAEECADAADYREDAVDALARRLDDWITGECDSVRSDNPIVDAAFNVALGDVDWRELATDWIEEAWKERDEPDEPDAGDYVISGDVIWQHDYPGGALGVEVEWEDKARLIREHANREKFWPNVWQLSDHGNWNRVEDWTWEDDDE